MKKAMLVVAIVLLCIAVLFWQRTGRVSIQNIWDEMYYGHYYFSRLRASSSATYEDVGLSYTGESVSMEFPGKIREIYSKDFVDEQHKVAINWDLDKKTLKIINIWVVDRDKNEIIYLNYTYYVQEKRLVYEPIVVTANEYALSDEVWVDDPKAQVQFLRDKKIVREDFERENNLILQEHVYPNWIRANVGKTGYSMQDLGSFEIVDNQFQSLTEEW